MIKDDSNDTDGDDDDDDDGDSYGNSCDDNSSPSPPPPPPLTPCFKVVPRLPQQTVHALNNIIIIIIIIIYNLYRGKAPVTRSDFQGGPLRVKIKYTKAKNIQYN